MTYSEKWRFRLDEIIDCEESTESSLANMTEVSWKQVYYFKHVSNDNDVIYEVQT